MRKVAALEERVRFLESQLRKVKGESWRARLKAEKLRLEQELDQSHYFYYHGLEMGLNCIIRGTLELRSIADVDEEDARLAEALLDDLLALIHKHHRPVKEYRKSGEHGKFRG